MLRWFNTHYSENMTGDAKGKNWEIIMCYTYMLRWYWGLWDEQFARSTLSIPWCSWLCSKDSLCMATASVAMTTRIARCWGGRNPYFKKKQLQGRGTHPRYIKIYRANAQLLTSSRLRHKLDQLSSNARLRVSTEGLGSNLRLFRILPRSAWGSSTSLPIRKI